jgi:hypothetical protein
MKGNISLLDRVTSLRKSPLLIAWGIPLDKTILISCQTSDFRPHTSPIPPCPDARMVYPEYRSDSKAACASQLATDSTTYPIHNIFSRPFAATNFQRFSKKHIFFFTLNISEISLCLKNL